MNKIRVLVIALMLSISAASVEAHCRFHYGTTRHDDTGWYRHDESDNCGVTETPHFQSREALEEYEQKEDDSGWWFWPDVLGTLLGGSLLLVMRILF